MGDFVHLHVHTAYSLLDGACRIDKLISHAKKLGQKAIAITDHGVMYGAMEFYKEAEKAGIKPIIGCEVYVAARSMHDKTYEEDYKRSHLVLLAKDNEGYKNLVKIVSLAHTDGFYVKPRVDKAVLREFSKGLICLSACIEGEIPKAILNNDIQSARLLISEYVGIFGKENFFLELQDHGIAEEVKVAGTLARLAAEYGVELVATNDVHYIEKRDAQFQDVLMCIQMGKTIYSSDRLKFQGEEFYLKSHDEMSQLFSRFPNAISNTIKIAQMCDVRPEFGKYRLPKFDLPKNTAPFEKLQSLCRSGLAEKYGNTAESNVKRLDYELEMIKSMGFIDYFLIVWDFIRYAKEKGIYVGPGRGSAAGSLVSYCLGITDIDPIKYDLIFERFLNPQRVTMPDIDIDFDYERRGEVIDYVVQKYGKTHVAQIITFGTMKARQAVRDVGRVLDISYAEVDAIAKMIPSDINQTLENALKINKAFGKLYEESETARRVIDVAKELEGLPRHASTHAAGVVITKGEVSDHVPLALSEDVVVTQFTMTTLEELGLLKMDFLGLRNLTIISQTINNLKEQGIDINIKTDAPEVYELISSGNTDGVFQLESKGMKAFMRELCPKNLEDIIAGISLYRPGPMDSIPTYLRNKNDEKLIKYKHPLLEPILKVTYGCIVYQEQVMQIVQTLAGYSLGRADILRRAMSKKKSDVMERERKSFIYGDGEVEGAVKNGVGEVDASAIFDDMIDFAKYAFNKSHAAAYAQIAYQTAWLKTFYPTQFMAALLTAHIDDMSKVTQYIGEMNRLGIRLLAPDINESGSMFAAKGENISFGLAAVKNVGKSFVEQIVQERAAGKYKSLSDFCRRTNDKGLNKRAFEALIMAGAFDSLGGYRSQYLSVFEKLSDEVSSEARANLFGQVSLIDDGNSADELPNIAEFARRELLTMEKEVAGIYLSGHPLDNYKNEILKNSSTTIGKINESFAEQSGGVVKDGQRVRVAGVVTQKVRKYTKNDDEMAFVTLEDLTGQTEIIVFPKNLLTFDDILKTDSVISVSGRVSAKEEEAPKIILDGAYEISKEKQDECRYYIKIPKSFNQQLSRLTDLLLVFGGDTPVYLYFEKDKQTVCAPKRFNVSPCKTLSEEIKKILGKGSDVVLQKRNC
ncbi:MAG: DNA polymerase III subunit alpha [Firmicutes bacterium]|nr:DNA polymerase III subunit alpha [Bacillota bacterium]